MCKRAHSQVWSLSVFRQAPLPIEWSSLPMYGVRYPRESVPGANALIDPGRSCKGSYDLASKG